MRKLSIHSSCPNSKASFRNHSSLRQQIKMSGRSDKPIIGNKQVENLEKINEEPFKHLTEMDFNLDKKSDERSHLKNINNYRHIYSNTQTNESNIDWVLDLRGKNNSTIENSIQIKNIKNIISSEPSFYYEDLDKYKQKVCKDKQISVPISKRENVHSISHLIKDRMGETANISQIRFELNLRKYKNSKNKNYLIFVEEKEFINKTSSDWKSIPFIPKSRLFSSYGNKGNNNINQNKKITIHNILSEISKDSIKNILKVNHTEKNGNVRNKFGFIDEFLGENKSLKPYIGKYTEKNLSNIEHILRTTSHATAQFETGLRNYK